MIKLFRWLGETESRNRLFAEKSDLKDTELVPDKRRMLRVCLSSKGPKGEAEAVLACVLGKDELVIRIAASICKPIPD